MTPSPSLISSPFFPSAGLQLRLDNCANLPLFPTRTGLFLRLVDSFPSHHIYWTGKKKKRTPDTTPHSPACPQGPLFLFPLSRCFSAWAFSRHTPLFGLWGGVRNKRESLFKTRPSLSTALHFKTTPGLPLFTASIKQACFEKSRKAYVDLTAPLNTHAENSFLFFFCLFSLSLSFFFFLREREKGLFPTLPSGLA